ncbi:MAG TPA: response regulator [Planctomycetota bacterium]
MTSETATPATPSRLKVLLAEDSPEQREYLEVLLTGWGYPVLACKDGDEAWRALQALDAPALLLLDSVMPGLSGPQICRRLRETRAKRARHIILLTACAKPEDVETGLDAGADDFVAKPFNEMELRARLRTGERHVLLQEELGRRVVEVEAAMTRIRQLEGILPLCSYCKRIREGERAWQPLESFISRRSKAKFSHDICPDCWTYVVEPELKDLAPGNDAHACSGHGNVGTPPE